jgi:long-chain fatty acid transport protein
VVLAAGTAFAGAFRIPEAGTPAMGQANAFVGQADDPSAVHHNVGAITGLEGTQIMVGANFISPRSEFEGVDAVEEDFFVPYFFYTNQVSDSDWWLGFGVNAPFGLGTEWDDSVSFNGPPSFAVNWIGETTLEIVKVAPVAAYRVNDKFSIGFGPEYYKVQEVIYDGGVQASATTFWSYSMKGDGDGIGFTLGGLYQASDTVRIGLAYHSAVTAELSGDAFMFPTATAFYTGKASVDLNIPDTIAIGINFQVNDSLSINLDVDRTNWSEYDKLEFKDTSGSIFRTIVKNYEDVTAIRVGGEYSVDESWTLRAGLLSEPTPVIDETFDPRLPDADATAIFVGAGYDTGAWAINGAFMALDKDDRNVVSNEPSPSLPIFNGEYKSKVTILAMDLTYRF